MNCQKERLLNSFLAAQGRAAKTHSESNPMKQKKNILYAQSGGVTSVINATACGVIETAFARGDKINTVLAGINGISGVLREELADVRKDSDLSIAALRHTPSGTYGSCRYRLQDLEQDPSEYQRLIDVFRAHNVAYFLYNGGGDSQDTTYKVSQIAQQLNYPITCIGIPKTIDNDLPATDNCPGFGSVAKYVAVSTMEAGFDVASMCDTSTKVFVLEVMGRHAGWIAAASGLASQKKGEPPHLILFPEVPFVQRMFTARVKAQVQRHGYCVIVASEGARTRQGKFLSASRQKDDFGNPQLGGVAPFLADLIKQKLGYKCHWAVADYLQRSARHIASQIDVDQAYSLGCAAVDLALEGRQAVMATIKRQSSRPYRWKIGTVPLKQVANQEKKLPADYISEDGFHISRRCRRYLHPLIQGEAHPPYRLGLPRYVRTRNVLVKKKLKPWKDKRLRIKRAGRKKQA